MKTETPDQSHKLLKLCQWDTKFEEQSAHMMSKTCSSFNKLWFCKKQLKEIAREILLLGVLMLFRKTYRINQGLLNKPEVTLCIPGKGIRGVHNCWKSWKGRGRSHPQRSRKPGLKEVTSTTTTSRGSWPLLCNLQILCGCLSQTSWGKGTSGYIFSSFPLWCSGDLRKDARLTKI